MTFRVGQKVVCVNADANFIVKSGHNQNLGGLEKGVIYEVRWVGVCPLWGLPSVKLVEIVRGLSHGTEGIEVGYSPIRFRPVQETGMSILRAIAANPKRELEAV